MSLRDSAIFFAYVTAEMTTQRVETAVSALNIAMHYYFGDPSQLATLGTPVLRRHLRANPDASGSLRNSEAPRSTA